MKNYTKPQLINGTWHVTAWDNKGNEYTSFNAYNKTESEAIEHALFGLREVAIKSWAVKERRKDKSDAG